MDSGSDYLPLQQPGPGYGPGAGSGAAANYLTQQSPAPAYAPGQGSGGGAAATAPKTTPYVLPDPETGPWSGHKGRVPHVSRLPLYIKANAPRHTEIRRAHRGGEGTCSPTGWTCATGPRRPRPGPARW